MLSLFFSIPGNKPSVQSIYLALNESVARNHLLDLHQIPCVSSIIYSIMSSKLISSTRFQRLFSTQSRRTKIGLLGAPYNKGAKRNDVGCDLAPNLLRQSNLISSITDSNEHVDVKDFGDLEIVGSQQEKKIDNEPKNMHYYDGFMSTMHRLSEKVSEIRKENRICITLGGDHAIAVGMLLLYLIWMENRAKLLL